MNKIIIVVSGGLVQSVFTTIKKLEVGILDKDILPIKGVFDEEVKKNKLFNEQIKSKEYKEIRSFL